MQNDISVSELIRKVQADLEQWQKKFEAAQNAMTEASAKSTELAQTLSVLQQYAPGIALGNAAEIDLGNGGEFSAISLREGIRIILQRADGRPLLTSQIAKRLAEGGMRSRAAKFSSNVSATLSVMQSQYKEVTKTDQGWILAQPSLVEIASDSEAA